MADNKRTPPVTTVRFSQDTVSTSSVPRTNRRTPWRQRRYTPYAKTPQTRNLRSALRGAPSTAAKYRTPPTTDKDTSQQSACKEFLNKTWRVCRVSPLYKLSYSPADLRQYARVLSAHLEVENLKNQAVRVENDEANLAAFSVLTGLEKSRGDSEAIKIDLKQKTKNGSGEPLIVVTAILLCVHGSESIRQSVAENFTLLPVMLIKGPVRVSKLLTDWLQVQFDCVIHPVIFPPVILWWMVSMWAGSVPDKGRRAVELQYRVPAEVEGVSTITMTVDAHDCKQLWQCIHRDSDDSFHENEVKTFIKSIEAHFHHHFQINVHAMPLCKVGTSVAYIGAEGKMKIFSTEHVCQILSHVTECVMENTLSLQ